MSWIKRQWRLLRVGILREQHSPEYIARGWALGMFVGCAIPFGLQLCISIPLSFVIRGSRIGAALGTLLTNPVTIFFIYPAQTWVADRFLLGGNLAYSRLCGLEWTFETVKSLGSEMIAAFFLGGLLLALIMTPLTYIVVLRYVHFHRERRLKKETKND